MEKKTNSCVVNGAAVSAESLNKQQWTKYHTRGGHGFAAEDANAMSDAFSGKRVDKVGMDNALDGADRISAGVGGGMAGFSAGAALGSLIPIPVVGTLAGGLIGGAFGAIASSSAVRGFFGLFK